MIQIVKGRNHGDPTDELWNHAVLDEILRVDQLQQLGRARLVAPETDAKAHSLLIEPVRHHVFESDERTPRDEQDVGCVDLEELLVGMFPATLRGHVGDRRPTR